jgi:hypothetical protein
VGERDVGAWTGPAKKGIGIDLIKEGIFILEKFQIKYGIEVLEIRNNFSYWSFLKFGIEFELKIQGSSRI